MARALKCEYELDIPELWKVSGEARDFVEALLVSRPDRRLTAGECLSHPWLSGLTHSEVAHIFLFKIFHPLTRRCYLHWRHQWAGDHLDETLSGTKKVKWAFQSRNIRILSLKQFVLGRQRFSNVKACYQFFYPNLKDKQNSVGSKWGPLWEWCDISIVWIYIIKTFLCFWHKRY